MGFAEAPAEGGGDTAAPASPVEGICAWLAADRWRLVDGALAARLPELEPLRLAFDRVLVRSDGYTFEITCLQDRLARPEDRVALTCAQLVAIGTDCLRYAGTVQGRPVPVQVRIWEICGEGVADHAHLVPLRAGGVGERVFVSAASLRPGTAAAWSNRRAFGSFARRGLERMLRDVRAGALPRARSEVSAGVTQPWLTRSIIAALAAVFLLQLLLGAWDGFLTPTLESLVALGGLQRPLVLAGDWYRMASAALLHGSPLHLAMNCLALGIGGGLLERLVGRAWLAVVFCLSALGGTAMSLTLNDPNVVSVGASGAVVGVIAAGFAVSFRLPHGPLRTRAQQSLLQMLLPSLLPLAVTIGGSRIDYGAHLGGAIVGAAVGGLLTASWPAAEPTPPLRRPAATLALACALLFAAGLAQAVAMRDTWSALAPDEAVAAIPEEGGGAQLADLRARFPRDPRVLVLSALHAQTPGEAESLLRAALREERILRLRFPGNKIEALARAMLAHILLDRGARAEAGEALRPSCGPILDELARGETVPVDFVASVCGGSAR